MNFKSILMSALLLSTALLGASAQAASHVKFYYECGTSNVNVLKNGKIFVMTTGADGNPESQGTYQEVQTPSQIAGIVTFSGGLGGYGHQTMQIITFEVQQDLLDGKPAAKIFGYAGTDLNCTLLTPAQPAVSSGN